MAENFRDWFIRNHDRSDIQEIKRQRQAKKAEQRKAPKKARKRSIRKPYEEQIFEHPVTGEYLRTTKTMMKMVGFALSTFQKYKRNGWIPEPYRHPQRKWRLYTERQITLIRRLYIKMDKRDWDRYEFVVYMKETWNALETEAIARKPGKHIKNSIQTVGGNQSKKTS